MYLAFPSSTIHNHKASACLHTWACWRFTGKLLLPAKRLPTLYCLNVVPTVQSFRVQPMYLPDKNQSFP